MSIPYSTLPSFNELLIDYISNFDDLKDFYNYDFKNDDEILRCIHDRVNNDQVMSADRSILAKILESQNRHFDSSEKTFSNIQKLNESNTYAVVTGQQLGLLTGPLYTVLKAINTIQLSKKLNKKFTDFNFVPVFWLEADDHDFQEVNNINIITKNNELRKLEYFQGGQTLEKYLKPTGSIVLDDHINTFIDELKNSFNNTDFSDELFAAIQRCYSPGTDMKTAFARFLNFLLKDSGLIFIDPSDREVKEMLKPVFKKELDNSPQVCEKVINTSVELEKRYSVQVKPQPINVFYIHEGNRYLLEPRDNDIYALKHSRQKFTEEELYLLLETHPERFSWNVVTRPVCQDFLLPSVAYIGGPSEISYFGQFKDVYDFFGVIMPVIYPRTSVTIIENRVKFFMEKYGLEFRDLLNEKKLAGRLLKSSEEKSAEDIFENLKEQLTALFYTYEKELQKIDPAQTDSFVKRSKQFTESLDIAKDKFTNSQSKKNEVITNQMSKAVLYVFPDNELQERSLNITYFVNKYGRDFIDRLTEEIQIDTFEHQLLSSAAIVSNGA